MAWSRNQEPVRVNRAAMTYLAPNLSVVVPTRNEERNVEVLLERLCPAVEPLGSEIVFVDDSDDGTRMP